MSGKNKIFPIKFQWCQGIMKNLPGNFISPNWQPYQSHDRSDNWMANRNKLLENLAIILEPSTI